MRALGAVTVAMACLMMMPGCAWLRRMNTPPARYAAGQEFGDKGATPCVDAAGRPCIHKPKQWLKPCE